MMKATLDNSPLVSVPVVTYNSAETIVETLDSIYNQTYPNIELIVSDDASKDNTVEIVRQWMETHKDRFVRTELITIPQNKGVSANYNRATSASNGDWIKWMDGDDLLVPEAIAEYMHYVMSNEGIYWCFARAKCFGGDVEQVEKWQRNHECDFYNWAATALLDYLYLSGGCPMFSPTAFCNRKKYVEAGIAADERVRNAEDRVMWVKMIEAGFKVGFVDKPLVEYRISENSLSTRKTPPPSMILANQQFQRFYTIPYIWRKGYKWLAIRLYMVNEREMTRSPFKRLSLKILCRLLKILFGPIPTMYDVFNIRYAYWVENE